MSGTSSTVKKKRAFLAALQDCGRITIACEKSHVPRRTVYNWRDDDKQFEKDWDKAIERAADVFEDEAIRRAYEGYDEPIVYQGNITGSVKKYSDTLLIFLLKGNKSDKYKDRASVDNTSSDGSMTPQPSTIKLVGVKADDDEEARDDE
jgi:hypothetical protein